MSKWCNGFWISAKCTKKQKSCGYKTATCYPSPQGICPTGWHLPTLAEWRKLFNAVGGIETTGKKLKSKAGWNVKSDRNRAMAMMSTVFPYSRRDIIRIMMSSIPQDVRVGSSMGCNSSPFWTATDYNMKYACKVSFGNTSLGATEGNSDKSDGYPVRCIRNAE